MRHVELRLPELHPAQQTVVSQAKRFNALMAGRRFGKSTLGRHLLIDEALRHRPAAWVAPTYKLLLPNWREVTELLKPIITAKGEEEKHIQIAGGGEIDFWSADGGEPAQGRSYGLIIFDECALIGNDLERLWTRSLRPTLADLKGSAWFLSTPKAATSYFATLFGYGQEGREDWMSWRIPTSENPFIDKGELAQARADMPLAAWQQEFGGELVSWTGSVFNLDRAVVDGPLADCYREAERPTWRHETLEFYLGCDWAGSGRRAGGDFTAFIVCASDGTIVHVERFRADFAMQRTKLQALCRRFRPSAVLCEGNSIGMPQIESLRREHLSVQAFFMTNATKARLVEQFSLALENGQVKIPDIDNRPILLAELMAFEGVPLPNGLTRFQAASGSHDDLTIACLLAWECGHRQKYGPRATRVI